MINDSHETYEENIRLSKSVVDACHPGGVPVEAELGKVGGKEDDLDRLSEIRIAFSKGVKSVMTADPNVFDPKKYNTAGCEEVKKYVMQKMLVVGSDGKAAQKK